MGEPGASRSLRAPQQKTVLEGAPTSWQMSVRPMLEATLSLPAEPAATPARRFARLAWWALGYTLFVILFGAVVRITGSGAGCGQHWPTCQGEVAHLPRSIETSIELGHRVTSGLSLIAVVALAILAFRRFPHGHGVRKAAAYSVLFMITEALIGAALVLLALVGENDSVARAAVMSAHLVNTSLLTAAMAVMAWGACNPLEKQGSSRWLWLGYASLCGVIAVSTTGAVTALGDTLYPMTEGGLAERLVHDQSGHFLERLRALHPIVAIVVGAGLLYFAPSAAERHPGRSTRLLSRAVIALVLVQVAAGVVNVALSAPGWMQVLHLALATALWIVLVLLTVAVRTTRRAKVSA
jgi:heme a synthase